MKKLYGVTTAMVTPFDERGCVKLDVMREMVGFLIARGVHCLYPCGTTGEMFLMPEEQRMRAAEAVIQQAAGRVTVYVHVGAMDPEETVRLARHACDAGADGIGVGTPVFFGTNPEAMVRYYLRVFRAIPRDFPAYLYNIPQCAANDLTCGAVRRICDACPNVVGIKYSLPDMVRTYEYLGIGDGFEVVQGTDRLFLPALAMGCAGTVSGVSAVYPEPFVRVYEAWQAGDIDAARHWQCVANRFVEALGAGTNMAMFKCGLAHRGIDAGHMHAPQIDLSEAEAAALTDGLERLESTCPEGLLVSGAPEGSPC